MSNDAILILAPAASVANNIALSQTPSGAGALTLNGSAVVAGPTIYQGVKYSNYATLDIPRRIQISDAGTSDTAIVFTVAGFNRDGQPQTETITGVTSATPAKGISTYDYQVITSILASAATSGAITVGTVTAVGAVNVAAIASSAWVLVNPYSTTWQLSAAIQPTGTTLTALTGALTVEHTYDDPNKIISPIKGGFVEAYGSQTPPVVWPGVGPTPLLSGVITRGEAQYADQPIQAHRVTIYAGTTTPWAGGSGVIFWSLQGGIKS